MADSSWEVVKHSKKSKLQAPTSKNKAKGFLESMPRVEANQPLKESDNIFKAFAEKDVYHSKTASKTNLDSPKGKNGSTSKIPQLKAKKSEKLEPKPTKRPFISLEEAIKTVKVADLEDVLLKDQGKFPNSPLVWLMDLASFINLKLDRVVQPDAVFHGKPTDYPYLLLPTSCVTFFHNVLSDLDDKLICTVFEGYVTQLIQEQSKGISAYGYRIAIQLIARFKPDVLMDTLPKLIGLIRNNQHQHQRCLSIMWAAGQLGYQDLNTGIRVWREVMLPVLNIKALAQYVVEYLETLFKLYKKKAFPQESELEVTSFFALFDLIWDGHPANLIVTLQKRLQDLFPSIKIAAFSKDPPGNLKPHFASCLDRLKPGLSDKAQAELFDCLVLCLVLDTQCLSSWKHMYLSHLKQSCLLMGYFVDHPEACKSVGPDRLRVVLQSFGTSNTDLIHMETYKELSNECTHTCEVLLSRLQTIKKSDTKRTPWFSVRGLFSFLIFLLINAISLDFYMNGGIKEGYTYKLLEDLHLLCVLQQVMEVAGAFAAAILSFLQDHVPYMYEKLSELLGPYLRLALDKALVAGESIVEMTGPARVWIMNLLKTAVLWIDEQMPYVWTNALYILGLGVGYMMRFVLFVWSFLSEYAYIAWIWLEQRVFYDNWSKDNLHLMLINFLRALQGHLEMLAQWISETFKSIPPFKAA